LDEKMRALLSEKATKLAASKGSSQELWEIALKVCGLDEVSEALEFIHSHENESVEELAAIYADVEIPVDESLINEKSNAGDEENEQSGETPGKRYPARKRKPSPRKVYVIETTLKKRKLSSTPHKSSKSPKKTSRRIAIRDDSSSESDDEHKHDDSLANSQVRLNHGRHYNKSCKWCKLLCDKLRFIFSQLSGEGEEFNCGDAIDYNEDAFVERLKSLLDKSQATKAKATPSTKPSSSMQVTPKVSTKRKKRATEGESARKKPSKFGREVVEIESDSNSDK